MQCPYCDKAFIHATYLQSHLQRKHIEFMTVPEDVEARKENERLAAEMESMRDKMRLTESQFEEERQGFQKQIENQEVRLMGVLERILTGLYGGWVGEGSVDLRPVNARKENERLVAEMDSLRDLLKLTESQFEEEQRGFQKQRLD